MNPMRELLLDIAAQLFAAAPEPAVQEAVEEGQFPGELWREIDENGLPSALLPEEEGGAGVGLADAMAVLRVAGAFALPLPLLETTLGRWFLSRSGLEVPAGPLALAVGGGPSWTLASQPRGGGAVSGPFTVAWPGSTVATVAVVLGSEGPHVARLEPAGVEEVTARNMAGEPELKVTASRAVAIQEMAPAPEGLGPGEVLLTAACARAVMLAGAMDRVLDLTLEHARGRVQFGRPIGRFQAIQQQIAVMASEVAAVGVAADEAALRLERSDGALDVAVAKARASEAAARVAKVAHQVHGAIGYTREHVLHRFTRRLWMWRDEYGDEAYWQGEVGRRALAAGGDGLWDLVVGEAK